MNCKRMGVDYSRAGQADARPRLRFGAALRMFAGFQFVLFLLTTLWGCGLIGGVGYKGGPPPSTFEITSPSLPPAPVSQPYSFTLAAANGKTPFTWGTISGSGSLPPGLSLDSSTGVITGTPTASNAYIFTLQVTDSSSPQQTATMPATIITVPLDQYGGRTDISCANTTGHFILSKVNNHWWFCTPAGHAFISMDIAMATEPNPTNDCNGVNVYPIYAAKYGIPGDPSGGGENSKWQRLKRISDWGFNGLGILTPNGFGAWNTCNFGQNGCNWPSGTIPIQMPMVVERHVTIAAVGNLNGYLTQPIKDVMRGVTANWTGSGANDYDVFDPRESAEITTELSDEVVRGDTEMQAVLSNSPWILGIVTDDTDEFTGFQSGPDFVNVATAGNPAILTLMASPVQTMGNSGFTNGNVFYPDALVYAKAQATNPAHGTCSVSSNPCSLRDYLYDEYSGSISALNTAWGSNYTTFDSTGTQITGETVTVSGGSYTFAHTNVSPLSVAFTLTTSGGSALQIAGDCPQIIKQNCGGSAGTGQIGAPGPWVSRMNQPWWGIGGEILDSNGDIEEVMAVNNSGRKEGNSGPTQPTWPARNNCSGTQTTTDGQLTWTCIGPEVTGTITYSTGVVSLKIGGAGSIPSSETLKVNYIYGGWEAGGTGLMDENGSNTTWVGTNDTCLEGADPSFPTYFTCTGSGGPHTYPVPNANANLGADLDNWVSQFVAKYAKQFQDDLRAAGSNIPYMGIDDVGSWGGTSYSKVLEGMAPHVDMFFSALLWDAPAGNNAASTTQSPELASDFQYLTKYSQDKPIGIFMTTAASADSDESCGRSGNANITEFPTQAAKGQAIYNTVNFALTSPGFYGDFPIVEFDQWTYQDIQRENWGLVSLHDNAYDGREAVTAIVPCNSSYTSLTSCGGDTGIYGDVITRVRAANLLWLQH